MGTRLFRYMWLSIGIISVVDLCLAIEHRDVIHETEQNPIAKAIIVSCGLAVFSVVKILGTLVAMWFMLQADIAEAKELPEPADPEVTRMEFDLKDQMIRQTIMTTQEDIIEIKETLEKIEDKLYNR